MRLPVIFLMMTVAIDAMGIGLIIPVMPDLIQEVSGGGLSTAALWGGVLATIFAVMQFLCAPFLGHLSDIYGRRPVLLITLAVVVVDYMVMGLAGTLALLVIARALGGAATATQSTASAAMADLHPPDQRAHGFGLIGAAFGLGFVIGPLFGGLLAELGTRAPFWAAAGLCALNWLLGLLVFPETVTEKTRAFSLSRANPFGAFYALSKLPGLTQSLLTIFLYHLSFAVYPLVWAYFGTARFGWTPGLIGVSLGVFGVSMAVVQAGLIRLLIRRMGEAGTALFGLIFLAIAFTATAFVPTGAIALALIPLAALGGTFGPAVSAMLSQRIGAKRQGELQGVLSATAAVAMIVAPLLMTTTFAWFTAPERAAPFAGAPFVLALGLTLIALALFLTRPDRAATS
ncbi:MFS transporter [Tropicibacter naphthalenivorans]|uniref:Tetracycline resistance protein, class C n=1 Tax=Tropicibacter naphthalenivorans TaxID=441103 RepID=A0A0P1GKA9_9RHOB|nr:MFS transporter [Tropicibacter naphthalenivorans]CUH75164.1 Tetracycline resistance protein, class C [Tropicibacter naphthalenivorans]SMC45817.1 MFS transporter, DHA1 family, tetracycline resistance protein [Tropicibacter naphthalenivorans]